MGKNENLDEEMTVELNLEDGTTVVCAIITILDVDGQDYIVLLPLDEDGNNDDGEVWFYRYSENPDDPYYTMFFTHFLPPFLYCEEILLHYNTWNADFLPFF